MSGLTFAKFFPGDWRGGTVYQLTVDEEGMFIRSCAYMWDTGECIPGDDKFASRLLNVQIQKYQKLMGALIEKGKMTRGQGVIFNERVLEEISEFQRQSGHQSIRAKRGHETKRLTANAVRELMEEVSRLKSELQAKEAPPHQPPHQPPVAPGGGCLGGTPDVPHGVQAKKANKINEHEQSGQKSGTAESRSQKPEARRREEREVSTPLPPSGGSAEEPCTGFLIRDERVEVYNGTAAALAAEFPGIDLRAVLDRVTPAIIAAPADDRLDIVRQAARDAVPLEGELLPLDPPEPDEKKRRRSPRVPYPGNGYFGPDDLDMALGMGLSEQLARYEFARFRDYNLSKDSRFADWRSAWRNWVTKAIVDNARNGGQKRAVPKSQAELIAELFNHD